MNVASAVSFVWDTKPDFPSRATMEREALKDALSVKTRQEGQHGRP